MKKNLIFLIIMLVVITGCGKKEEKPKEIDTTTKLECTKEDDGELSKEILVFKEDKLIKMDLVSNLDSDYEIPQEEVAAYEEFACGMLASENVDCLVEANGKVLTIKVSMNVEKMTEEEIDLFGLNEQELTYESLKEFYLDEGYTCQ